MFFYFYFISVFVLKNTVLCFRPKDRDYDKDDEEDAYERKKQERKIREKEAVYQEVCILLFFKMLYSFSLICTIVFFMLCILY